jgi:hypothetical protein
MCNAVRRLGGGTAGLSKLATVIYTTFCFLLSGMQFRTLRLPRVGNILKNEAFAKLLK